MENPSPQIENTQIELDSESQTSIKSLVEKLKTSLKLLLDRKRLATQHWRWLYPLGRIFAGAYPINHILAAKIAGVDKGKKVLEVASGWPFYKIYSGRVGKKGIFVALDIDDLIQRSSYKLLSLTGKSPAENPMVGNAYQLPFSDESFDVVLTHNPTLSSTRLLQETGRVLKPGGTFLLSQILEPLNPDTVSYISRVKKVLTEQLNFDDVKIIPLAPGVFPNIFGIGNIPVLPISETVAVVAQKPLSRRN